VGLLLQDFHFPPRVFSPEAEKGRNHQSAVRAFGCELSLPAYQGGVLMGMTPAQRRATVAQFRKLIQSGRRHQVENAIAAGRSLAKLLLDGRVILIGVDDLQLERYRRRFRVPKNLKGVMYSIATRNLDEDLLNIRLDSRFPFYTTASGKKRYVKRCALCAKRTCRCFPGLNDLPALAQWWSDRKKPRSRPTPESVRKQRPARAPRVQPILVSVRGIPVERV
jgi:hypothetical protein